MHRAFINVTSDSGFGCGLEPHESPTMPCPGSIRASVTTSRSSSAGRRTTISSLPSSRGDPRMCAQPLFQISSPHRPCDPLSSSHRRRHRTYHRGHARLAAARDRRPRVVLARRDADPRPGPGEVRVALRASALNHLDLWVSRGMPAPPSFPHVSGADGAGVVDAIGDDVDGVAVGDEVVIDPSTSCGALLGLRPRRRAVVSRVPHRRRASMGNPRRGGRRAGRERPVEAAVPLVGAGGSVGTRGVVGAPHAPPLAVRAG